MLRGGKACVRPNGLLEGGPFLMLLCHLSLQYYLSQWSFLREDVLQISRQSMLRWLWAWKRSDLYLRARMYLRKQKEKKKKTKNKKDYTHRNWQSGEKKAYLYSGFGKLLLHFSCVHSSVSCRITFLAQPAVWQPAYEMLSFLMCINWALTRKRSGCPLLPSISLLTVPINLKQFDSILVPFWHRDHKARHWDRPSLLLSANRWLDRSLRGCFIVATFAMRWADRVGR